MDTIMAYPLAAADHLRWASTREHGSRWLVYYGPDRARPYTAGIPTTVRPLPGARGAAYELITLDGERLPGQHGTAAWSYWAAPLLPRQRATEPAGLLAATKLADRDTTAASIDATLAMGHALAYRHHIRAATRWHGWSESGRVRITLDGDELARQIMVTVQYHGRAGQPLATAQRLHHIAADRDERRSLHRDVQRCLRHAVRTAYRLPAR